MKLLHWKRLISFLSVIYLTGTIAVCLAQEPDSSIRPPRTLAPDVMRSIQPFVNYSETYQWSGMPDILGADKTYDWAQDLFFTKEIWCLEFSFKPVRMMVVEYPTDKGTLAPVLIWYMVYSVTNTGKAIRNEIELAGDTTVRVTVDSETGNPTFQKHEHPSNNIQGTYHPVEVDYILGDAGFGRLAKPTSDKVPGTIRFIPQFVLTSTSVSKKRDYVLGKDGIFQTEPGSGTIEEIVYYDDFLPLAFAKISEKEDSAQKFYTSITMASLDIPPGETIWGIVTWADVNRDGKDNSIKSVDPRIDRFSVYVSGLTNAVRWEDTPEAYVPDAPPLHGRDVLRKVLKLNFYRPGDEFNEKDQEVFFGQPGELDYQWIFM